MRRLAVQRPIETEGFPMPISTRSVLLAFGFALAAGFATAQTNAPLPPIPGAIRPASPVSPAVPAMGDKPSLEKVNAYFNGLRGLKADFLQMSPDGRSFSGVLYLLRPGRMRFEYHPPSALEIVADGRSVAIRDRKLNTQDLYFIGQTPLKFLLQPRIDVAKDSKVTGLARDGDRIVLTLEDKSTIGGTSRIRVVFDGTTHALQEWTVTDPQGHDTRVLLSNLDPAANPETALFVINEQKLINPN